MKATDIIIESGDLFEVAMDPTSLRKAVADIPGAMAGLEFEMIVPGASGGDDEMGMERDLYPDERLTDFEQIEEFFNDGNFNSRSDVRRLMEKLAEGYSEYSGEKWYEEGSRVIREYVEDNGLFDSEEAQEEAEEVIADLYPDLDPDSREFKARVRDAVQEKLQEFVDDIWNDQDRIYEEAYEMWLNNDQPEQSEYLKSEGLRFLSDVADNYDITWPYWMRGDGEGSVEDVAKDFQDVVDIPVKWSDQYHGVPRSNSYYIVEPDSSLEGDGLGVEFISPPMPIDKMVEDIKKIKEWAGMYGAETNETTGLHMNISIPGLSTAKLDYVKLALLLGDKYVLEQFGRLGNTYTRSAIDKIRENLKRDPSVAGQMFDKMRGGLDALASKVIHSGNVDKYTSIHTKDNYIEFRSPGGDWLSSDLDKLVNTMLRFVVATDAAMDPQKYRKEYLKKLYQFLAPEGSSDPITTVFAQYSSGMIDKEQLKNKLQAARQQRTALSQPGAKNWWMVSSATGAGIEVVATSKEEALQKAAKEWGYPSVDSLSNATAKPIRPYTEQPSQQAPSGNQRYEVYLADNPDQVVGTFLARAGDDNSARLSFNSFLQRIGRSSPAGYGFRKVVGQLNELSKMAAYKNPIGMMEMYKFMQVATPEQKLKLKELITKKRALEAWRLLQQVTGTKLD